MPIAAEINGRLYAIHTDHLNTPRRLTNQQGQVAWQWLISGFGEVRPTTGDRGYGQTVSGPSYAQAVKFDLWYPGQVFDEETGLSYNLHRYYDAATGRYIQADPIGLEGGWNRFGYLANNPLNDVDPQGLHPLLTRMQGLYYRYGWQGAVNPGTPSKLQLWQAPENKQVQDTIPVDMRGKRKNQIRLAFICIIQPAICKTNGYKISEPA